VRRAYAVVVRCANVVARRCRSGAAPARAGHDLALAPVGLVVGLVVALLRRVCKPPAPGEFVVTHSAAVILVEPRREDLG